MRSSTLRFLAAGDDGQAQRARRALAQARDACARVASVARDQERGEEEIERIGRIADQAGEGALQAIETGTALRRNADEAGLPAREAFAATVATANERLRKIAGESAEVDGRVADASGEPRRHGGSSIALVLMLSAWAMARRSVRRCGGGPRDRRDRIGHHRRGGADRGPPRRDRPYCRGGGRAARRGRASLRPQQMIEQMPTA